MMDGDAARSHAPRKGRSPKPPKVRRAKEHAFDRRFEAAARRLLALGVHPNHFTFLQIPVFAFQIMAAVQGWRWSFALAMVLIITLDGGDGILARVGNLQSKTGAVLDALFDTMGILIVMWGAGQFYPELEWVFILAFFANTLLFLQNALLNHKVVAYVRGPALTAVVFPQTLWASIAVMAFILAWLLLARLPKSARALRKLELI